MSRTEKTMPDWVQLAHRAGVRLPRDWREPIFDPADAGSRYRGQRGLWSRRRQLEVLVGYATIDAFYVGHFMPGRERPRAIGRLATTQNRRMRHRDKQAISQGRYDTPPPRPRHQAHWDYW